jgi:hypothetical protein
MEQKVLDSLRVKTKDEIVEQLKEIVHRHRRRFIRRNMRPCPENCQKAEVTRKGVTGCPGCDSTNPEVCRQEAYFVPISTKEELDQQFREDLRDPQVLRHDYRDIMVFLWVLGQFDTDEVSDEVMTNVENRAPKGKE